MSQVAVAEVAVVPVFKGFRSQVTKETNASGKAGAQGFSRAFATTGTDSGKQVGSGFKKAFEQSANGASDKVTKQLEADVAKASRALSQARLKEQDAIGKVRVAQAQLNEANEKYSEDSSQAIRAQERLATASRQLKEAHDGTEKATDGLKKAQGELARAADDAGDELAQAGDKGINGFRSNVVGGVKGFAGPLIAAFAALGIGNIVADAFGQAKDFVLDAIGAASDLEQSVGGVDAVFGDQADAIHEWASEAAQSVGLSKNAYNEFATVIGSQFKNMGIPMDQVAGKTDDLIGLASDLAATYGGTTSEAVEALSSLLRGERDPIERYGVTISDATLEARLLAKGLGDLEGPAKDEAKRQETLAALYEQTADAQGGAIREQDSYASMVQQNSAKWENISATIGDSFLPIAEKVAGIIGDDLMPAIAQLAEDKGPELAEAFADVLPKLAELAEDVLPLLPGLLESFADALPAIIELIGWLAPLMVDVTKAGNDQIGMYEAIFGLLSGDTSFSEFGQKLLDLGGPIGDVHRWGADLLLGFQSWFGEIASSVSNKINETVGFIAGLPGRALAAIGDLGKTLYSSGQALMGGFLDGVTSMFAKIGEKVSDALEWVKGFFPNSPALRGPLAGSGWTRLEKSGEAYWDQWLSGMGKTGPAFPAATYSDPETVAGVGGTARAASPAVSRSVVQYIYPQQTDPRLQMRQWGREAERAFSAS
ncbi:hypothetical protein ACI3KS_01860 [Microbacterium sp. ZW T5_45]|uniref:phage tail protein n=1 Tax=Microbacterium sp. ZW T5_45 TaxID=3378080 RepID=UPI00385213E9